MLRGRFTNCAFNLLILIDKKRRGWDLNPRWSFPHSGFRDRPVQPLQHLSGTNDAIFYYGDYSLGFSFSETELMQYLNPVGLGPSGKT